HRRPGWRAWTLLISGACLIGLAVLFHADELKGASLPGTGPSGAFYAVLAAGVSLMLTGAWDMRLLLSAPALPSPVAAVAGSRISRKVVAGVLLGVLFGGLIPLAA